MEADVYTKLDEDAGKKTIYKMARQRNEYSKDVKGGTFILEWTTSLDTSSSTLFVCRGLCPAGFIAHLRLYRHIRQAAIPVLGTGFIAHL